MSTLDSMELGGSPVIETKYDAFGRLYSSPNSKIEF